ncbi:hypothetical protein K469DRAFT_734892 [Zopfia rhizophila CBS 207.26]|uniref:Fanconi-associated nuclease n=1 Tax=Zopfia rhizophila CBS 207.26 TaxID=1314779 RepID=A0A6A6ESA8_9PEZI|nr:hypothetical protein K469DRAFT_734892 [Zopfia rhizophila CBS 207.26]
MALSACSRSKHNQMLGRLIQHPKSTNFDGHKNRPVKRRHPEAEDDDDIGGGIEVHKTDLESALPPIKTDAEAIEEYEAFKASQEEQTGGAEGRLKDRKWARSKSSLYVDAFNLALDTVLDEESHLFDEPEMEVFRQWRELSDEAQYLYVRPFLRKTATWHRIKPLGYHSDISDMDSAIEALQRTRGLPSPSALLDAQPGELEPPAGTTLLSTFTFADRSEDEITTLEEASSLLKLDKLKALAKDAKVQGNTKKELLKALRRTSQKQVGLGFVRRFSASSVETGTPENEAADDTSLDANRGAHFTRKIMDETRPCIQLSTAPHKLFERVHLVFYRSTEWTEKSLTAIILAKIARWNFPEYIVSRSANIFSSRSSLLEFEASIRTQFRIDNILEFNGNQTEQGYQEIIDTFEEVYPRWKVLLREEQQKEDSIYESGEGAYLRRLSPAWVYIRTIHKATGILARREEYQREHELLSELLQQRFFHHSRRGAWYQRKAFLEEHYMASVMPSGNRYDEAQKKHWRRIALKTCEDALKIPKRAQHDIGHVRLATPIEATVQGIRIERERPHRRRNSSPHPGSGKRGAKTIWIDPREDGECSVEEMCLSHYRNEGWKGYHSEGGIARTLFAYLFYDILFTYVPNIFSHPIRLINHRLNEISNGDATSIIQRIWDEHHERRTCVVGLDWTFDLQDLLEIAQCFDGGTLATVCKVMAQEYGQRGGGVPDLFLWKMSEDEKEKGDVKFAEVKSENDRLSDTQRLWIHVLTGAGVRVELCNAVAKEVRVVG